MTNKIIVDCSTGEVQEIALTEAEIAEREAMAAEYAVQKAQEDAEKAALSAAKQAGQDKLKALGLTDLEIAAITGA